MRISIVEPDGAGGLLHYAYQMAGALHEAGAEVTLITARDFELDHLDPPFEVNKLMRLWPATETSRGGKVARLFRRGLRAVWYTWEWERLTRHLIRSRPDIVQFSSIRFPYLSFFLRRMHRKGLTLTQVCHEFELREARVPLLHPVFSRMARAVYCCLTVTFFHGAGHRDRFVEVFGETPGTLASIPHGNEALLADSGGEGDRREHYAIGPDRPVALFFGGLRPSKGIPDLLEAFADVLHEVDATLIVAGRPSEGLDVGELGRLADDLGLGGSVIFDSGYVPMDEVAPLIRTSDVVVLPYRSGTASGVIQAAYASARPVIATDVGSLAEAVDHGKTGMVVPPGDRVALTRALVKLLENRDAALAMGTAGRRAAEEQYGWAPIAATILETYRGLS